MTEADEIAVNLPLDGVVDWATARAIVAQHCGPPEEFGHVQTDNVVRALVRRALYAPQEEAEPPEPFPLEAMVVSYEEGARQFRPDWDVFVSEAKANPIEIHYEVEEHARAIGLVTREATDTDMDALLDRVTAWINSL